MACTFSVSCTDEHYLCCCVEVILLLFEGQQDTYSSWLPCLYASACVYESICILTWPLPMCIFVCFLFIWCLMSERSLSDPAKIPGWPFLARLGASHSPLLVPLHGMFKTSGTSCKSWPASETTLQSAAPTSEDCFILLEKECIMDTAPLHF